MVAIRERKRKQTEERIFYQAKFLFGAKGVRDTTMEDIAEKADVGVGTLYNYFRSKGDLLVCLIKDEAIQLKDKGEEMVSTDSDSIAERVSGLCMHYVSYWRLHQKSFWQELIQNAIQQPLGIDKVLLHLNHRVNQQIETIFSQGQAKSIIPLSCRIGDLSTAVYSVLFTNFLIYSNDPGLSIEQSKNNIDIQIAALLKGAFQGQNV